MKGVRSHGLAWTVALFTAVGGCTPVATSLPTSVPTGPVAASPTTPVTQPPTSTSSPPSPQPTGTPMPASATPAPAPPTATPSPGRKSPTAVLVGPDGPVTKVAWSPDGTHVAATAGGIDSKDARAFVWHADGTLLLTLEGHTKPVQALAWSPDGAILATGSADATVRLWKTTGELVTRLSPAPDPVFSLAWSPDGTLLAVATISFKPSGTPGAMLPLPGAVHLVHPDGQVVTTFTTGGTGGKFLNLAWSPDGMLLAAGAMDYGIWRPDGTRVAAFRLRSTPAWGMAWSPDGRRLAVGDENGFVEFFDAAGQQMTSARGTCPIASLAFSPDGATLAVQCYDGLVLRDSTHLDSAPRHWYPNADNGAAWSRDGQLVAGMTDGTITVWRPDGTPLVILDGCGGKVQTVAWAPDGTALVAGSKANKACLWKPPAGA